MALKQLLNHSVKEGFPITAMREISIVKKLNHENVLKILEMVYEEPKVANSQDAIHQRGCFYTVSSYMSSDLVGILENPNIVLSLAQIKCLMAQLLRGVQYIHEQNYLHRDIKAANILIGYDGVLKIADFGLARLYHGKPPVLGMGPGGGERTYTGLVVTRWYRPPELLLGERKYTTAVDMWGVGCVFGELFTCKPILAGKTDSHQCQIIFQLVGPPSNPEWAEATGLPNKTDLNIGLTCKRTLESKFAGIINDPLGLDLFSKLLTLNPYKRYNALDALEHEFFRSEPLPADPKHLEFEECHEIDKEKFKKLSKSNSMNGVTMNGAMNPQNGSKRTENMFRAGFDTFKSPEKRGQSIRPEALAPGPYLAPGIDPTAPRAFFAFKVDQSPQPTSPSTNSPNVRNSPTVKPTAVPEKRTTSASSSASASGIFMPKRKKPRPIDMVKRPNPGFLKPGIPSNPKSPREVESDLTDFDDDVPDQKLEVLDLDHYEHPSH